MASSVPEVITSLWRQHSVASSQQDEDPSLPAVLLTASQLKSLRLLFLPEAPALARRDTAGSPAVTSSDERSDLRQRIPYLPASPSVSRGPPSRKTASRQAAVSRAPSSVRSGLTSGATSAAPSPRRRRSELTSDVSSTLSCRPDRRVNREEFAAHVQAHLPGLVRPELFEELKKDDCGLVGWLEVLDYFQQQLEPAAPPLEPPFQDAPTASVLKENRRSVTVRLLVIPEPVLTYLTVSAAGTVSMYDAGLRHQRGYQLPLNGGARARGQWAHPRVTDAVYLANSMHFVYATSDRALHFYDASASVHLPEYQLTGLPDVPTCLASHCDPDDEEAPLLLIVGDDGGDVFIVRFLRPTASLFKKIVIDRKQVMVWQEMAEHSRHVQLLPLRSRHLSAVTSVGFCGRNQTVISTSEHPDTGLILQQLNSKWKDYVFRVEKGTRVVDYSWRRQLAVTGGEDGRVRLWNPLVPQRPLAVLCGHCCRVVDVAIHETQSAILSIDGDAVVNVWDGEQHVLLQSLLLPPPPGRRQLTPEFGARAILVSSARRRAALLLCSDVVYQLTARRPTRSAGVDTAAIARREDVLRQERAGSVAQLSSSGRRLPGSTRSDRRSGGSFTTHLSQSSLLRRRRLPDLSPLLAVAPGSGDSGDSSSSDDDAAAVEEYLRRVASAPPAFIEISVPVIPQPASHNLTTHRQMGRQLAQKPETVRLIHACTPFRALSLQPLQELPSPAGLPLTSSMRRMGLRCSTLQEVLHMKLPAAAAAKPTGVKPTSLASSVASIGRAKRRHRQASLASSGSLMSF